MPDRVAVLVTCHNRVSATLRCLEAVTAQRVETAAVDVIVLDAGSTDGTVEAIQQGFPGVTLLNAGADVFWNGGMSRAFDHARRHGYDYYLWLNDDTVLDENALEVLRDTERQIGERTRGPVIVVGSTRDPDTGALTYGGVRRADPRRPLHFEVVKPGSEAVECDAMNGNAVLVPHTVAERVGVLDPTFTHGMGDFDYGLRARRAGCSVWVAPGTVGTCARNAPHSDASLGAVLRRLRSPKGLPPREWFVFARRWAGPLWPLYAVSPYVRRLGAAFRR